MILAAAGHRPDKLGGYDNPRAANKLRAIAQSYIVDEVPDFVISGMALGWDQYVAEAALSVGALLVAAVPFAGQETKWPTHAQQHYRELLARCVRVVVVCEGGYAPQKMQVRNEWMVNKSDRMLAMWNGSLGGTANCIKYAEQMRRPIDNLWTQWRGS